MKIKMEYRYTSVYVHTTNLMSVQYIVVKLNNSYTVVKEKLSTSSLRIAVI